jgi:hypothetical protein
MDMQLGMASGRASPAYVRDDIVRTKVKHFDPTIAASSDQAILG